MTYKRSEKVISPYQLSDLDRDLYQLGIEHDPTAAEQLQSLRPLLKLLAAELKSEPSGSTIDQVAKHLEIIAEQSTKDGSTL